MPLAPIPAFARPTYGYWNRGARDRVTASSPWTPSAAGRRVSGPPLREHLFESNEDVFADG
ncbi:hypothetical protein [Streptomyces sp. NPDC059575]|uniref:hypothetical protein n=1 Tax=Streptomyces sp. NPDC059575 TaxID=3346872 RepID=UPI0036A2013B